jgi:hypothetical protein
MRTDALRNQQAIVPGAAPQSCGTHGNHLKIGCPPYGADGIGKLGIGASTWACVSAFFVFLTQTA